MSVWWKASAWSQLGHGTSSGSWAGEDVVKGVCSSALSGARKGGAGGCCPTWARQLHTVAQVGSRERCGRGFCSVRGKGIFSPPTPPPNPSHGAQGWSTDQEHSQSSDFIGSTVHAPGTSDSVCGRPCPRRLRSGVAVGGRTGGERCVHLHALFVRLHCWALPTFPGVLGSGQGL